MIAPDRVFIPGSVSPVSGETMQYAMEWTVPATLPYLAGHFPERPILPAVAIVDASMVFLRFVLDVPKVFAKKIESCKISGIITPDMTVTIKFDLSKGRDKPRVFWLGSEDKVLCDLSFELIGSESIAL